MESIGSQRNCKKRERYVTEGEKLSRTYFKTALILTFVYRKCWKNSHIHLDSDLARSACMPYKTKTTIKGHCQVNIKCHIRSYKNIQLNLQLLISSCRICFSGRLRSNGGHPKEAIERLYLLICSSLTTSHAIFVIVTESVQEEIAGNKKGLERKIVMECSCNKNIP